MPLLKVGWSLSCGAAKDSPGRISWTPGNGDGKASEGIRGFSLVVESRPVLMFSNEELRSAAQGFNDRSSDGGIDAACSTSLLFRRHGDILALYSFQRSFSLCLYDALTSSAASRHFLARTPETSALDKWGYFRRVSLRCLLENSK